MSTTHRKEKMAGLTASMENYLEAISILSDMKKKYVRIKDIAEYMKVKMPSATGAIIALARENLVDHEKYGHIELTEQGARVAKQIRQRHDAVLEFLTGVLNIDLELAERDAHKMEHTVSETALGRILKLVECIQECPKGMPECLKRFNRYVEQGRKPPLACRRD